MKLASAICMRGTSSQKKWFFGFLIFSQSQVAQSNAQCLAEGGSNCLLNYEVRPNSLKITVRVQDNGSPPLHADFSKQISLTNVNDQPRDLQLLGSTVEESSSKGTVVGTLTCADEDAGQRITFSLPEDDGGRFAIANNTYLVTAKDVDYEESSNHIVKVVATDNGSPAMKVWHHRSTKADARIAVELNALPGEADNSLLSFHADISWKNAPHSKYWFPFSEILI